MVIFSIKLNEFCFKVSTNAAKNTFQIIQNFFGENATAILGDEDQVNMKVKNTVPAVSDIVVFAHRPKYNSFHENPQTAY